MCALRLSTTAAAALSLAAAVARAQAPMEAPMAAAARAPAKALTFCAGADNLPMSQEGAPAGVEVELARALAARLGMESRFVWLDAHADSFEQAVLAGRCDAALGAVVEPGGMPGARPLAGVALTAPFYGVAYQLVRRADAAPVRRLAELGETRVAVEGESIVTYTLRQRGRPVHVLRTADAVIAALADGRARYGYLWGPVAAWLLRDRRDVVVDTAFVAADRWNFAMAMRERDYELRQALNDAGQQLTSDGTLDRILAAYRIPCCAARQASGGVR